MRTGRRLTAAAALAAVAAAALVGDTTTPPGVQMSAAARTFLDGLPADLRPKAAFPFDSPERLKWHFVPLQDKQKNPTRKGVRLEELPEASRKAALALLRSGTSPQSFEQATAIMSLESVLAELEAKKPGNVRSPGWYFVSVFGEPSQTAAWGWRVEGHHLSVNVTLEGGKVVAAAPMFFGANPAVMRDGPRKGEKTIPEVDDLARQLFDALDADQRALALREKPFEEIEPTPAARVGPPAGVPYARLTDAQKATVRRLLKAYTGRMPGPVGEAEYAAAEEAGLDKVHFAFTGGTKPGEPHTYRVQGPTFLVEFLNVQADAAGNPANHIHSCWRHLPADFGLKQG